MDQPNALADVKRWMDYYVSYKKTLPDKLLNLLPKLKSHDSAFPVNRYEHSLQTASRALRAGEDDEMVVVCLFHDVGELFGVENHGSISAALLKPYISPANHWLLQHHIIFQGYYYYDKLGVDKNLRDQYKSNPMYDKTVAFCANYDEPSFDPHYDTLPLSEFEPIVHRVFEKVGYQIQPGKF